MSQAQYEPIDLKLYKVTPYVQFHHDMNHWVASAFLSGGVVFADSLNGRPSVFVARQMKQIYRKKVDSDGRLKVRVLDVQKQTNKSDCGVFAAANAFSLASLQDPAEEVFDTENKAMRTHLAACFEARTLLPFPSQRKRKQRGRPKLNLMTI